jgi:hypothetical protein
MQNNGIYKRLIKCVVNSKELCITFITVYLLLHLLYITLRTTAFIYVVHRPEF